MIIDKRIAPKIKPASSDNCSLTAADKLQLEHEADRMSFTNGNLVAHYLPQVPHRSTCYLMVIDDVLAVVTKFSSGDVKSVINSRHLMRVVEDVHLDIRYTPTAETLLRSFPRTHRYITTRGEAWSPRV